MTHSTILPGGTIGVLGSGQLGRMFAIAARRMGYRVHVLSPDDDTPTGQVADVEIQAPYSDMDAVTRFARGVDAVTFEFENVPAETTEAVGRYAPVRPGGHVLHTTQNRIREKSFLRDAGLPVAPFHAVRSAEQLAQAMRELNAEAVVKTAAWGYDGKGQQKITPSCDPEQLWLQMGEQELVLEQFVDLDSELSIVAARGMDGNITCYAPITNIHANHILDVSISPADISKTIFDTATEFARHILRELDVVGVLCVEFFLTRDGQLLINELAPRPHNSGHLTINAHVSCQFEQQVRAVCGLPLGSVEQLRPAAMANLLGDLWERGEPQWSQACQNPNVKLHLYGKRVPRAGRKMGHLTAVAETTDMAARYVLDARKSLTAG